jgi:OOP family OmpA-OmpF porin
MSLRIIFLMVFTILYFIIGQWLYTFKVIGTSSNDKSTAVTVDDQIIDEDSIKINTNQYKGVLTFNWSDELPIASDNFENYQNEILIGLEEGIDLEITGYYFSEEEFPHSFENLGMARADELRKLFIDFIGEDRIIINSKLVDDIEGAKNNPFEASEFNWVTRSRVDETTIREFDLNNITINFPFNSSDKEKNKEMDDYLLELAVYLRETGKSALVNGHTDSTGDPVYNYHLGLQRAIKIRNLLVEFGADKSKISVDSKGKRYPIASNLTREGEYKNRRVEIRLN